MRKLIAAFFTSLDGVIQAPGGPEEDPTGGFLYGGWGAVHWDEAMGDYMGEGFGKPFDLLLGRRTYDIFAAHWPFTEDGPAALFNGITKYVATSSEEPLAWQNSEKLEGDAMQAVARLKEGDGPDLLTQGSAVLVRDLLAAGLVDELSLMTFPVLLGHGKRWYGEDAKAGDWELLSSRTSTTGVIMSCYRPRGPIRIGDFQLAEPSAAELARREKLKLEG
ncbi:dihydrofolate reductase family protein [Allosphingosinicella sp.]|uniref:dihydrofolate reductase family protein n=1 Tax=Allosphingosinicella sp. TaxID=2823234 RepID=UPI0037852A6F